MMKCRGMGAAMRKMGGGSMKPVAMKEGKTVKRKAQGRPLINRDVLGDELPIPDPDADRIKYESAPMNTPRTRANIAAQMERRTGAMANRRAKGKSVKRKMKGKSY